MPWRQHQESVTSMRDLPQSSPVDDDRETTAGDAEDQAKQVELAAAALARLSSDDSDPKVEGELVELLGSLQAGTTSAVWRVIEQYEPHVRRVVRRRLSRQLRSRYDTMDFVQMVWKSFFEEPGRIQEFDHPGQLVGFLVKLAQRKVDTEFRRRTATERHAISKEEALEETTSEPRRLVDSPSQIAIARERWDHMVEDLPPHHREVVRLRLQGLTFEQIAQQLGLDERTARRVLSRLTKKQEKQ